MNPLLLVLLPAYLAGSFQSSAAVEDDDMSPKLAGIDSRYIMAGLGALASMLMTGPIGLIGLGISAGSLVSLDATNRVKKGINKSILAEQVTAAIEEQKKGGGDMTPAGLLRMLQEPGEGGDADDEDEDGIPASEDDDDDNWDFLRSFGRGRRK